MFKYFLRALRHYCHFTMRFDVFPFLLICGLTFVETINENSFNGISSNIGPELLPGVGCTCVEMTKCPSVCRLLRDPEISALVKHRHLKNITCEYKGFTQYVCCDEKIVRSDWGFRNDLKPFHHNLPTHISPQFYPGCESLETSALYYMFYPYFMSHPEQFVTKATTRASARELLPTECGVTLENRIIGGKIAAYPWIARLGYRRSGESGLHYLCGGSLINDRYVITAAYCVSKRSGSLTLVSIRLGEVEDRSDCNQLECADRVQDFSPEEIKIHNGYDNPKYQNDIALIRLNRPVKISLYVSPICLPLDHSPRKNYTGQEVIAAGWGQTNVGVSSGRGSHLLQSVELAVVSPEQCAQVYEKRSIVKISEGQICAGGEEGKGFCNGDGGGPLILSEQNGNPRYVLIGLVSFGPKYCGIKNVPGVYTKTSAYTDWILDNLRE